MRTLLEPRMMPPTGFFYIDPDTEYMVEGGTLSSCIELAKRHRNANQLPIADNFAALVEDFICLQNDPDFSIGDTEKAFNVPLTESWIRSSVETQLQAWKKNNREFVDEQVAHRRAEICAHCQMNVRTPVCFSCVGLDVQVDGYFKRTTPIDSKLRVCKMTAVPNKSQVHLPGSVLIDRKKPMPDECWYKAELEQRKS